MERFIGIFALQIMAGIVVTAVKLTWLLLVNLLRFIWWVLRNLLRFAAFLIRAIGAGTRWAYTHLRHVIVGGQVSTRRIAPITGGHLRIDQIPLGDCNAVAQALRPSGLIFAIEKARDGNAYLHYRQIDANLVAFYLDHTPELATSK